MLGSQHYGTAVDMWSIGCIFAEMACNGQALFPGKTEDQQLLKIFKTLGVPSSVTWPQLNDLPKYKTFMQEYGMELSAVHAYDPTGKIIEKAFPYLKADAVDLMNRLLQYDPSKR